MQPHKPTVFFDGHCNLCNGFVDFVINRTHALVFAPLQGSTAKQKLPEPLTKELETLVLLWEEKIYLQSDAVIRIAWIMGGPWKLLAIALILPRWLRDFFYRFVAKRRYIWFGKRDTCRLPTPEERALFLD